MNYAALSQMIPDGCENAETSFVAHIPDFVKAAEQRIYQAVQLPATRKRSTGTATAGNRYLTVPTDFLAAFAASIVDAGTYYNMQFRDVDWLRAAYPEPAAVGVPLYYGLIDDTTFLLSKTPAVSYVVELHYYYKPSSIVDTGTSWLGTNFDNVLFWGSMVQAYLYLKGEDELVKSYDAQFKEGLSLLKSVGDDASKKRLV